MKMWLTPSVEESVNGFSAEAVKDKVKKVGIEVVTTIGLPRDSNLTNEKH